MTVGLGTAFEEVLAAAQAGAEWAFAVLYRDLNPRIVRYFGSRVPSEAQDLASETWMGAARQLASFSGDEEDFRRWMFTIAHHRLVQHWRSAGRRREEPAPDEALVEQESAAPDPSEDVVGTLSASAAAAEIAALLSPEQAEIVLLRVLGGLSVEEVAAVVGKRPGTVRVMQHRALRKLHDANFLVEVTQ